MRVLLASGIDGFCHRYAVLHWAEQLALQGIGATVRAHRDPRLAADVATHDLLLLYRGFRIAIEARGTFNQLLAAGLTSIFGIQTLIISAGNLKLLPLTGIPLPSAKVQALENAS